ncbi:MAG TPA: hypothetical protein VFW94_19040 [Candidatus Acidoferrales bacterium]|nr:hypothetical protein [Candidatus Acidoferrales bacterium]
MLQKPFYFSRSPLLRVLTPMQLVWQGRVQDALTGMTSRTQSRLAAVHKQLPQGIMKLLEKHQQLPQPPGIRVRERGGRINALSVCEKFVSEILIMPVVERPVLVGVAP